VFHLTAVKVGFVSQFSGPRQGVTSHFMQTDWSVEKYSYIVLCRILRISSLVYFCYCCTKQLLLLSILLQI